jgi:hypothetical protein|tara:strand:+ start:2740 stop:3744 length:1005 start_codon:yes stop_codon:yes gene_type:complete
MTQVSLSHQPRLYIDNKLIDYDISGSINFKGNNQLNTLSVKITNIDLQFQSLFNKSVKLYLNSNDSVPIFRGFVTQITPTDTHISIQARDVRTLINGKDGVQIDITDKINYDTYTLAQFLFKIITDENLDIGLDFLKDSSPPISLKEVRGKSDVYKIITDKIKDVIDDSDINEPLRNFIDVYDDGNKSHIVIKKDTSIESNPSYNFSFNDGLISYNYNRRNLPNTIIYEGGKQQFSNIPTGTSVIEIKDTGDRAKNKQLAIRQLLLERQQKEEITIQVTKCYDIALGTIIHLDVDEEDILGNHRVVGKKINFGSSMSCSLMLNKEQVKLSDYLQ